MYPSIIHFNPQAKMPNGETNLTLLLGIDPQDLEIPKSIKDVSRQHSLLPKSEYHCTVLGFSASHRLNQAAAKNKLDIDWLTELVESYKKDFEMMQTLDYYLIERTYETQSGESIPPGGQLRRSLINLLYCPQLTSFIQQLNIELGKEFALPEPFPHVSLFTAGQNLQPQEVDPNTFYTDPKIGIGIDSEQEFKSLKKQYFQVSVDEVE
jgi:hypothetical protein